MPQERHPKQALLAKANGKRPVGQPIELDLSITLRAWMESHRTSSEQIDGDDGRP